MRVRRSPAAIAAIALSLVGLTACDPPPPPVVLIVASNGDAADTAPGDGLCRAPSGFPGIFTCTLRAALQEASASHVDRITSPPSTFRPATPLVVDPLAPTLTVVPSEPGRITIDASNLSAPAIDVRGGSLAAQSIAVNDAGDDAIAVAPGATLILVGGQVRGAGAVGIDVAGTAVVADTVVRDSGSHGIALARGVKATVLRSSLVGNGGAGLSLAGGRRPFPTVESTTTSGNSVGIAANGGVLLRLSTVADGLTGSAFIGASGSILAGPCTASGIVGAGSNAVAPGCGTVGPTDVAIGADALDLLVDDDSPHHPISDVAANALGSRMPSGSGPCRAGTLDQLGRVRTSDGSCSIGAHELIEPLGTVTVDTATDGTDAAPGDGVCATATGECTFRAALQEAGSAPAGSSPVVVIEDGVDPLLSPTGGRLPVDQVRISGGGATVDLGGGPGLAHCRGTTVIEDLTLTGAVNTSFVGAVSASCPAPPYGVTGRVELHGSTVTGNTGTGVSGAAGLDLLVVDSEISDNSWWGIGATFDRATIQRSILSGNGSYAIVGDDTGAVEIVVEDSTIDDNGGGISSSNLELIGSSVTGNVHAGVDAGYPDVTIVRSLVAGNGAGIDAQEPGTVTVSDSTISGNTTGAAVRRGAEVVLRRSTLAANATTLSGTGGSFSVAGSILAAGTGATCSTGVVPTSVGWNVADDASCGLTGTDDQQGVEVLLGALGDNGGPTDSHLPGPGSPAVDVVPTGTTDLCAGDLADQRGVDRPQGTGCDAGAVEATVLPDGDFVVTSEPDGSDADVGDGTCATPTGTCTLRAAVEEATAFPAGTVPVVAIAPGIDPVRNPGLGPIAVDEVTIAGGGATVDLAGGRGGLDYCEGELTVRDLTITGASSGGVIAGRCEGTFGDAIVLEGVTITGNQAAAVGGRGPESGVTLEVRNSTLSDNVVGVSGSFGNTIISRSTISGNSDAGVSINDRSTGWLSVGDSTVTGNGDGGGLRSGEGPVRVSRSSITDNLGAGVQAWYASIHVESSLIAGPGTSIDGNEENGITVVDSTLSSGGTAIDGGQGANVTVSRSTVIGGWSALAGSDSATFHLAGTILRATGTACASDPIIVSSGWNLIADTSCGLTGTADVQGVDPLLGPLADNGGPTLSHLPGPGSPAIGAIPVGTPDLCSGPLTDQRGVARPQGPACDRGAIEQ